jgi:hypothetical protein
MILYCFDLVTFEDIGFREAQLVNGEYITDCLGCTLIKPLPVKDDYVSVWNGTSWDYVEDHRNRVHLDGVVVNATEFWLPELGDTYYSPPRTMLTPGTIPVDAVTTRPAKPPLTVEELKIQVIGIRDIKLKEVVNVLDRHRNQKDYNIATTLTDSQIIECAMYAQLLRDFPESLNYETLDLDTIIWPTQPACIV